MINLKNNYCIASNGSIYTLCEKKETKDAEGNTKETLNIITYHTKLEYALHSYSNCVMADLVSNVDMDLKEVKQAIEELKEEIKAYE